MAKYKVMLTLMRWVWVARNNEGILVLKRTSDLADGLTKDVDQMAVISDHVFFVTSSRYVLQIILMYGKKVCGNEFGS